MDTACLTMTHRELDRCEVLQRVPDRRLTQRAAARMLGLSGRQTARLVERYRTDGRYGILSNKRGRPSRRKLQGNFRHEILAIVRRHYADFGPTLAHEKPTELHGVERSVTTLRRRIVGEGLWDTRKQRCKVTRNMTLSYAAGRYVVDESSQANAARGQQVDIYETEDGSVAIFHGGIELPARAFQKRDPIGKYQGVVVPNRLLAGVPDKILEGQLSEGATRLSHARTRLRAPPNLADRAALLHRKRTGALAVLDNFSRRILACHLAERLSPLPPATCSPKPRIGCRILHPRSRPSQTAATRT